jgi:hypothetical protein
MGLTMQQFLQGWPEFAETQPALVLAALGRAATRMGGPDYSVWGPPATQTVPPTPPAALTIADTAQGNYAAHILITSPFGTSTVLTKGKGKDAYMKEFEELELAVAGGFAVASRPV